MIETQVYDVDTLQKPLRTRWWQINNSDAQVLNYFHSRKEKLDYCYTLTSYNKNQKLHTISNNGLQRCNFKNVYTYLVYF